MVCLPPQVSYILHRLLATFFKISILSYRNVQVVVRGEGILGYDTHIVI